MSDVTQTARTREGAVDAAYALYDGAERVAVPREIFLVFLDELVALVDEPVDIEHTTDANRNSIYLVSLEGGE